MAETTIARLPSALADRYRERGEGGMATVYLASFLMGSALS
jgi:hypothetical protein